MPNSTKKTIVRDLSWLAFNERVLQEAQDKSNHIYDRLRFMGIFSNNLDEFFRVRVAALKKMVALGKEAKMHLETNPEKILKNIQQRVIELQTDFDRTYAELMEVLAESKIHIKTETQLSDHQKEYVTTLFESKIRTEIIPLMIESIPTMPILRDKAIYMACVLGNSREAMMHRFALIEIPTKVLPRFVIVPSQHGETDIILLEDIIRLNLPALFAPFGFDKFMGFIIKVTRDAELELDNNDLHTNIIDEITRGLKARKKGRATRFVYDRTIDPLLLKYLIKRLSLTKGDNLIPGGRIHNFKDFIDFPHQIFHDLQPRQQPFVHPLLHQPCRIMDVLEKRDVMLHLPYHSFDPVIDLLREAAIDPYVLSIRITCYRLAKNSKIINALINAVRNGKSVMVVLELRARFDEEANMHWKSYLEEEGVKVVHGLSNQKVHAKICVIKKREFNKTKYYGFVSTGNLNENTARFYSDHCLITADRRILGDVNKVFDFLEDRQKNSRFMMNCKVTPVAPNNMREYFLGMVQEQIVLAKKKKPASITLKMNSLVDIHLIDKLYAAARSGVKIRAVVRGICCAYTQQKSLKGNLNAISIIDEYLEHARVFIFGSGNDKKVFISSADWMVRNLDHRIEVSCQVYNNEIQQELTDILNIQLSENVKGRIFDDEQTNTYVARDENEPEVRAQVAIYNYLRNKQYTL